MSEFDSKEVEDAKDVLFRTRKKEMQLINKEWARLFRPLRDLWKPDDENDDLVIALQIDSQADDQSMKMVRKKYKEALQVKQKMEQMNLEVNRIRAEMEQVKQVRIQLDADCKTQQQRLDALQEKEQSMIIGNQQLEEELADLRTKRDQLLKKQGITIDHQKFRTQQLKMKIRSGQNRVAYFKEIIERFEANADDRQMELRSQYQSELDAWKVTLEENEQKARDAWKKMMESQCRHQTKRLENQLSSVKQDIRQLDIAIQRAEETNQELTSCLADKEILKTKLTADLQEAKEQKQKNTKKMRKHRFKLQEKRKSLSVKFQNAVNDNRSLKEEIEKSKYWLNRYNENLKIPETPAHKRRRFSGAILDEENNEVAASSPPSRPQFANSPRSPLLQFFPNDTGFEFQFRGLKKVKIQGWVLCNAEGTKKIPIDQLEKGHLYRVSFVKGVEADYYWAGVSWEDFPGQDIRLMDPNGKQLSLGVA